VTEQELERRQEDDQLVKETVDRSIAVQGYIEAIRSGNIVGWAIGLVSGNPLPLLAVRILHESGQLVGEGFATEYRRDVQDAGLHTGWCGFSLTCPALLPTEGKVTLQALVESTWTFVTQIPIADISSDVLLTPDTEDRHYFADLLTLFAEARTKGGTIGKSSMKVGDDLWIQATGRDAETTRAFLRLDGGDEDQGNTTFVRVESSDSLFKRVDVRFRLLADVMQSPLHVAQIPIRTGSGLSATVKVNIFTNNARKSLATFQVRPHEWVNIEVSLPKLEVPPLDPNEPRSAVWLEIVGSDLEVMDIGEINISSQTGSRFESVVVGAQSGYLMGETGSDETENKPVEDFTVVIPFFGNYAYTGHCVDAVLMNSTNRPHVILVDDGTAGNQGESFLGGLRELVAIIKFPENRGYTAAVNAGVLAAETPKVIILNNDTRVLPGWDAPLLSALDNDKVFAAGPLSNAASYQSVPNLRTESGWAINEFPAEVTPRKLADLLASKFPERNIDWPILNGFCYAVRASTFIDLGLLDQDAFPRGYGEEVDLMLRSLKAGYANLMVPSSFVYHYKSKTFGDERSALSEASNALLRDRWTEILPDVVSQMDESEELLALRGDVTESLDLLVSGAES